jgi:endonuclease/exonuclease/phosphatase family metal-dependent hydrolase
MVPLLGGAAFCKIAQPLHESSSLSRSRSVIASCQVRGWKQTCVPRAIATAGVQTPSSAAFCLQAASPSFPMATPMRLVSFNILEGFRPLAASSAERRLMDRDRAEAARTVVAELSPDILVLNEALFCRQHAGREVDYAALFGFRCAAVALYDEEWGNAILSRFPIVASSEMRIYNRGGLLATIGTPDGALQVASYHPHPRRQPENKALDFARLVEGFTGPALVCGDFNAFDPRRTLRGSLLT